MSIVKHFAVFSLTAATTYAVFCPAVAEASGDTMTVAADGCLQLPPGGTAPNNSHVRCTVPLPPDFLVSGTLYRFWFDLYVSPGGGGGQVSVTKRSYNGLTIKTDTGFFTNSPGGAYDLMVTASQIKVNASLYDYLYAEFVQVQWAYGLSLQN